MQSRFIHLIEKYLRFSSEELAIFLEIFSLDEHELQEYCSDNSVSLDYVAELMQESDDSEAAYDEEQEEASSVPILKTASVPVLSVRQRVTSDSLQTKTHSRQPSVAAVKTSIVNKSSLFSSQAVDVVPEKVNYSAVSCSLRAHAVAKTSQPKKLSLLAEKQEDRDESVYGVEKCLPFEFNRTAVSQKITATEKTDLEDTELQRKIGRWGEHFVFDYLRHHYQEKYPACTLTSLKNGFRLIGSDKKGLALNLEVTWYNQTDESGYPADIGITKNGKQRFIEVKSTNQPGESMAYITGNELKFMKEHGDRYRIFRVYNACQQDPNIVKIKDPARVMQEGGLEPYRIQVKI